MKVIYQKLFIKIYKHSFLSIFFSIKVTTISNLFKNILNIKYKKQT